MTLSPAMTYKRVSPEELISTRDTLMSSVQRMGQQMLREIIFSNEAF